MTILSRFRFFLWTFGHFKVPMIGYVKPRLVTLTNEQIVIKLALNRRSKNHLQSMYFGALAIGADLAGGLHGFYHAKKKGVVVSLAFKSMQADFLKRAESDVYFVCDSGETIEHMLTASQTTGQRINQAVAVHAFTHYHSQNKEEVARFVLELSLKVLLKNPN